MQKVFCCLVLGSGGKIWPVLVLVLESVAASHSILVLVSCSVINRRSSCLSRRRSGSYGRGCSWSCLPRLAWRILVCARQVPPPQTDTRASHVGLAGPGVLKNRPRCPSRPQPQAPSITTLTRSRARAHLSTALSRHETSQCRSRGAIRDRETPSAHRRNEMESMLRPPLQGGTENMFGVLPCSWRRLI